MNIKTIRLALMVKASTTEKNEEKDLLNYKLRYSSILNVEKILDQGIGNVSEDNFDDFLKVILPQIYAEVLTQVKDNDDIVDSIGIWIETKKETFENAIKLSVLDDIQKYGDDDINPIYEFYNMTILKYTEAQPV